VREVFSKFFADRGTHLAAMIAYFALLSFVPLLFLALALLGLGGRADESSFLVTELNKAFPSSSVEGIPYPIHVLQLTAMGMCISDSLQLEELAAACREEGRWEFLVVGLPLRLPGATGSPWNPIAIF